MNNTTNILEERGLRRLDEAIRETVAKLRDLDTGTHPVLLRTNMDAGHGGKSGRFRRYRELAQMYAFMLDQLGVETGK